MDRRLATVALAATLAVAGACRTGTVRIAADPQVGDRARYRYEIDASVTRSIEGGKPTTTEIATTVVADQRIVTTRGRGAEADVTLRRDGRAARKARVVLDQTGAISHIELIEGLDSEVLGLSGLSSVLFPPMASPPTRALELGARWSISQGSSSGSGRLVRLGVVDGADVGVVRTTIGGAIDDAVAAGSSPATLTGEQRSSTTTAYDLHDGTIRRSTARSRGALQVLVEPPAGVDAAPALGTISYVIEVRVTRLV